MQVTASEVAFAHPGAAPLYEGLSFSAGSGDLVALTGPSGSGKSTLLSLIGGWLAPTEGTLEITGSGVVSLVPQNPYGVPGRSALDHVCLPLIAQGLSRREAVGQAREFLALVKLKEAANRPYRMLSGGERQRMLLARGLASQPGMLLVDEPTAQLDASAAAEVCEVLSGLGRQGALIFVATHDHRVVDACPSVIDLLTAAPAMRGDAV